MQSVECGEVTEDTPLKSSGPGWCPFLSPCGRSHSHTEADHRSSLCARAPGSRGLLLTMRELSRLPMRVVGRRNNNLKSRAK